MLFAVETSGVVWKMRFEESHQTAGCWREQHEWTPAQPYISRTPPHQYWPGSGAESTPGHLATEPGFPAPLPEPPGYRIAEEGR